MRLEVRSQLVHAAKGGDPADIERLLEAVLPDAYRLARAIVEQTQSAEDVAQEACVIMFRNLATLRNPDAFPTWFYRVVLREALKHKKAQMTSMMLSDNAAYYEDCSASLDLWRALATLPERLRTVIVLHYFEDLSSREIGKIIRTPEATVRFRLMTARRRLHPLLQERESSPHSKGEGIYAL